MSIRQRVADKQHSWLSLVEMTGIVLSEPVLTDTSPAGFRPLEKRELAEFNKSREAWRLPQEMAPKNAQEIWVNYILERFLGLNAQYWLMGSTISKRYVVDLIDQKETLRPTRVLIENNEPLMLFIQVPKNQNLNATWISEGSWKASPTTKMERLLRQTGVEVGFLTNGEVWRLIIASPSEVASSLTWTTQTWADSPITLSAFKELLGMERFFAGPKEETIIELVRKSRLRQLDITDQLGHQVREALELIIYEIDRIDSLSNGNLLKDYTLDEIYEASVVLIMRLIFLFYAEENELLPHGNVSYDRSYGIIHLLTELEDTSKINSEILKYSSEAYTRLLALFRLVHQGSIDPDIRITAHGGRLFDPDRFPFLEYYNSSDGSSKIPLPIRDNIMRRVLRSLKYAENDEHIKQWVSYRTLSVEQIGYMYEGLLDRKLARNESDQPLLILSAISHERVIINLSELLKIEGKDLFNKISSLTGKAESTVKRLLEPIQEGYKLPELGDLDPNLLGLINPFRRILIPFGVIRTQGLFITAGQDRRSSGTHYTPTQLTEPIVRYTLESLVYKGENGVLEEPLTVKSARDILSIKVCDIAMGSGAFLVQAVRYLSGKLLEAWDSSMANAESIALTLPYGEPSQGFANEHLMPGSSGGDYTNDSRQELEVWAKRYVTEHCIYGVDINPLAVEMSKLSLWLESLSKDKPFTFIDNTLKCGDSLIGIRKEDFENLVKKYSPKKNNSLKVKSDFDQLIKARENIINTPIFSINDEKNKKHMLFDLNNLMQMIKFKADIIAFSDFFSIRKDLEAQLLSLSDNIYDLRNIDFSSKTFFEKNTSKTIRNLKTFHWELEFPEIFNNENPGFDAIIGNPPFLGGQKITGVYGTLYREYLVSKIANNHKGSADLVAYFFLRAYSLLKGSGNIGLVGVNTIGEVDTRRVGLEQIVKNNGLIFIANPNIPWPGQAAVTVSVVIIHKGKWFGTRILAGNPVMKISTSLDSNNEVEAKKLETNLNLSFQGTGTLGLGFILSDEQTKQLININSRNEAVIFPYINGDDLVTDPFQRPGRWVINFWDWPKEKAQNYYEAYKLLEKNVKPERQRKNEDTNEYKLKSNLVEVWWQFEKKRTKLYHSIGMGHYFQNHPKGWDAKKQPLQQVLITARVSKYMCFALVPNNIIFSDQIIVIASDSYSWFAVLQSTIHETWVRATSSKHELRLRYLNTESFETFPFPDLTNKNSLNELGHKYHEYRKELMSQLNIGLTRLYNKFHDSKEYDPRIVKLRRLHQLIDEELIRLYEWDNLEPNHGFHTVSYLPVNDSERFTVDEKSRVKILTNLSELNESNIKKTP